jgi:hypothetical protein
MDNMKFIANGGHWNVYKFDGILCIHPNKYENPIIKRCMRSTKDDMYIHSQDIHKQIKSIGIPTVEYCIFHVFDNEKNLICENLNKDGIFYVSPNTIRGYRSAEEVELLQAIGEKSHSNKISEEEEYCLQNQIKKINNYKILLDKIKKNVTTLAKNHISICEDAFFFGRNKMQTDVDLLYKLADFDNVCINTDVESKDLMNSNIIVGISALWEYIHFFMKEGEKKSEYLQHLQNLLKLHQNQQ